jgi:fatty-acid desaturase
VFLFIFNNEIEAAIKINEIIAIVAFLRLFLGLLCIWLSFGYPDSLVWSVLLCLLLELRSFAMNNNISYLVSYIKE